MMFKLILLLLIVSQIICDEEKQTFSDDEFDINTNGTKVIEEKTQDKQKPEFSDDEEDIPKSKVEEIPKKDEVDEESEPDLGKEKKKTGQKDEKEFTSGKDDGVFASGDENIATNNDDQNKDVFKDKNEKKVNSGSDEVPGFDENEKNVNKNEGSNVNEIMDSLLNLVKTDYKNDLDKVLIPNYGPVKYGRWGTFSLHSGLVSGLSHIHRGGDIIIKIIDENKKLILGDLVISDVEADFKVDAKLFHRIPIKNRLVKLWLKKALLNVELEVDLSHKKLVVSQINVKSIEGFGVKSGRILWPFNKLADHILKSQEDTIKTIIKTEVSKYMGKVVHNIDFEKVLGKIFKLS